MTFEEKGTWLYGAVSIALPVFYFATILGQVATTPVGDIEYQALLIGVIVAAIVITIIGMIGIGISSPSDAGKADIRDKEIDRFGSYVGGTVTLVAMLVPLGLAMVAAAQFWIANAIYLGFVVGSLTSTATKLIAYRRGL